MDGSLEEEVRETLDGSELNRIEFFQTPCPYRLNSERRWSKHYLKLRKFQRNQKQFKSTYTDRVCKLLGESKYTLGKRPPKFRQDLQRRTIEFYDTSLRVVLALLVPLQNLNRPQRIRMSLQYVYLKQTFTLNRRFLVLNGKLLAPRKTNEGR